MEATKITGRYIGHIMRDFQTGYTVFRVNTDDGIVTCCGNVILPRNNIKIEVTGIWKTSRYGKQLTECHIEELLVDNEAMESYLQSIPKLGAAMANRLVAVFGKRLYDVAISPTGEKALQVIPGMTEERAHNVCHFIRNTKVFRDLYDMISKYGGKFSTASKIYKDCGENSIRMLLDDPYTMSIRYGFGFDLADKIALEVSKLSVYDEKRIFGAMYYVVRQDAQSGNTYATYIDAVDKTRKILSRDDNCNEGVAATCIGIALCRHQNMFVIEDDRIYLKSVWNQEFNTARDAKRLINSARPIPGKSVEDLIAYAEATCHATYADQQREAFNLLLNGGIGIITGGPGTGKSTVIKGLLCAYEHMCPDNVVKLCAPTGRAAQRMKEVTGHEATTIHKLLEYTPYGDRVSFKDENDPIEADLLIVDESSMISIDISAMLFNAIQSGTTVLLVGDINQLPAVGAGNVLGDMIESGIIPTVKLIKTYRQAGDSLIINNANRIRTGVIKMQTGDDFEVMYTDDDEKIPGLVSDVFKKYYREDDIFSAQVLCPGRRKRSTGSAQLSRTLQTICNLSGPVLRYGENIYHKGDKVMFMKNNYACGYFNGDMGTIVNINDDSLDVLVEKNVIRVEENNLDDLTLGLAITVHKSQGSECACAIVVLPSEPANMLQRNLFYTAVTRAKKKCIVIATKGTIEQSIKRVDITKRNSYLIQRLQ